MKIRELFRTGRPLVSFEFFPPNDAQMEQTLWQSVQRLARREGLRITTPEVEVKVERARAAIRDFKREPLDDVECFARTLGFARLHTPLFSLKHQNTAVRCIVIHDQETFVL